MNNNQLPKTLAKFIWYFVKKQKAYFIAIQILAFAWSLDNTVWPFVLRMLINKITAFTPEQGNLWHYLMPLLCFWVVTWVAIDVSYRTQAPSDEL